MNDLFESVCPCCKRPLPEQAPEAPARFEEFWGAYPHRKIKKGKKPCGIKYARAVKSGVSEQEIIDGAKRYGCTEEVKSGYARDPLTWLNQAGWDDESSEAGRSVYIDHAKVAAENIKSGKRFLCTHITGTTAREAIERGLVTKEECDLVGVSV